MLRPLVFALVLALSATGAWADMYDDCTQSADPDLAIRGCTQIIERGEQESRESRVHAYLNRGAAYDKKDDYNHAIADYIKAIALDENLATDYLNRGAAPTK